MMKTSSILSIAIAVATPAAGFQNLLPKLDLPSFGAPSTAKASPKAAIELEDQLLDAIGATGEDGRLSNSGDIATIIAKLEESDYGIARPAIAPEVYGTWRLLHTNNANTASPIQRKAVDSTKYNIYQNIELAKDDDGKLIVSQVVKFGPQSELKVDALASTSAYPLSELTERKGEGKVLGLNLLGVSLVGEEAKPDPNRPDSRVDFVFDEGSFDFRGVKNSVSSTISAASVSRFG
mmetsp:Transcript_8790/g.17950  ORF Transcript_8790/g.17950 Transcript_8790/m.17950 type:complete len:236 (-) Transcript_8790:201-908(-)